MYAVIPSFRLGVLALAATLVAAFGDVRAEELNPKEFDGVGITEHLGDAVPADLTFKLHVSRLRPDPIIRAARLGRLQRRLLC